MPSTVSRRYDAVIVLVALVLVALYVAAAGGDFPLDDSWIHQTYGRNLAVYGDWAYPPRRSQRRLDLAAVYGRAGGGL